LQGDQAEQGFDHLVLEAGPCSGCSIPASQNQFLQKFNAVPMAPKQLDSFGDVFMVTPDNGYLMLERRDFLEHFFYWSRLGGLVPGVVQRGEVG
jgi:hypothetical protein